jgi:hypothetical protein
MTGTNSAFGDISFADLCDDIDERWLDIATHNFWAALRDDAEGTLLRSAMAEVALVVAHSPRTLALALTHEGGNDARIRERLLTHAAREAAAENLAVLDSDESSALENCPPRDALIGYLYWVALTWGPRPRLGWSLWAQQLMDRVAPLLAGVLEEADLSFASVFSDIPPLADTIPGQVLREGSPEELRRAYSVVRTSMWLFEQILDQLIGSHSSPE